MYEKYRYALSATTSLCFSFLYDLAPCIDRTRESFNVRVSELVLFEFEFAVALWHVCFWIQRGGRRL